MSLIRPKFATPPLLDLVGQGETGHTEFKRLVHSPQKIAKSIAAFANTSGGVILIGVDDDKKIIGIESEKETLEIIYDAIRYHIEPEPVIETHIQEYKRRMVLLVEIPESPDKPHFHIESVIRHDTLKRVVERKVYTREGSHNRAATEDRICLMQSGSMPLKLSFGAKEKMLLSYLDRNARITAKEFADLSGLSLPKARRILISMVKGGAVCLLTEGKDSYYTLSAY
jgi:predicted HTH transcriptional regulator